jgi:hypothetical protein
MRAKTKRWTYTCLKIAQQKFQIIYHALGLSLFGTSPIHQVLYRPRMAISPTASRYQARR